VEDREIKALIIRQLQLIGKGEAVQALSAYLNTEALSGPAARALASINTPDAADALKSALLRRMGTSVTQRDIVMAIGDAQMEGMADLIQTFLTASDENLRRAAFYAIGRVGTVASLNEVGAAAKAVGFQMENTGTNEAYIQLIKHISLTDSKSAEKAATNLLKDATKIKATQTRISALEILMSVKTEGATKMVLSALKDPDKEYRNAALNFASNYAEEKDYVEIVKAMLKSKSSDVKVDVINWIGRESKYPGNRETIKNLEIRFDLPLRQVLLNQLAIKILM
jgi:HEAT repeat protein